MTMASSPSYLFVANANSVHFTCRWACEDANSINFIIKPKGCSSAQFLDPLEFNSFSLRVLPIWYSQTFCVPSQGFVLSYLMVDGLATKSINKQVYHRGWHHYNSHSCVGEGNNQFHQHTITVRSYPTPSNSFQLLGLTTKIIT